MSNKFNSDTISDDDGTSVGSVSSYVKDFKDIAAGRSPSRSVKKSFRSSKSSEGRPSSASISASNIPSKYEESTEKDILLHYYMRFGDGTCTDFEDISGKIASSINRLYGKTLTIEEVGKKLSEKISMDDVADSIIVEKNVDDKPKQEIKDVTQKKERTKIDLKEGNFDFIPNLLPLKPEQLDLCKFINQEHLCFSSDGYEFYLSIKPDHAKSFDDLLQFTPKEQMVYEMFKDQLNDEHKATKLVLMSRLLNEDESNTASKKVTKKKTRRRKKSSQEASK